MMTREQVQISLDQLKVSGVPAPDIIRQIAYDCIGWPYVFGAWGEDCTPSNRRRRERSDYPTIKSKCQVLSGRAPTCEGCQWGIGVRMFDCRGWTRWLLRQVGLDLAGQGATSQFNTASNWAKRGKIAGMPDCVCCVFRQDGSLMAHTGMHIGGGVVIDCSVGVRQVGMKGWTHYGIPRGLYSEEMIPMDTIKPTLRKGSSGDIVKDLQDKLNSIGYDCGTADGKFGERTRAAVMAFQRDHGLTADGVVGRDTWAALETEDTPREQTYTVKCYGMTWSQVQSIRNICQTADVIKE